MSRLLATITWLAAIVASVGVALMDPHVMAGGAIVAAVAGGTWGFVRYLHEERELDRRIEQARQFEARAQAHGPYTIDDLTDMRANLWRPTWPHDSGAPE